jgi:hypothetical protein
MKTVTVTGISNVCVIVIASEAKQSMLPRKGRMDCFVASLLAMTEPSFLTELNFGPNNIPLPDVNASAIIEL